MDINDLYNEMMEAYTVFNDRLFNGVLPEAVLTLTRHSKAYGFFAPDSFRSRGGQTAPEIALNPEHFVTREPIEIYSTLVHEMCHYWQMLFGKPSRNGYHNKEFAATMVAVGLQPSSTGKIGGKDTGQNMSHYVIAGGAFETVFLELNAVKIGRWGAIKIEHDTSKTPSKVKYTCEECGQNAWAKPGAYLLCGTCSINGEELVQMTSAYLL